MTGKDALGHVPAQVGELGSLSIIHISAGCISREKNSSRHDKNDLFLTCSRKVEEQGDKLTVLGHVEKNTESPQLLENTIKLAFFVIPSRCFLTGEEIY